MCVCVRACVFVGITVRRISVCTASVYCRYLFAPYSVFTVTAAKWSRDVHEPHAVTIEAAHDGKKESEELPLAPWY